jgi:hypothetical protein
MIPPAVTNKAATKHARTAMPIIITVKIICAVIFRFVYILIAVDSHMIIYSPLLALKFMI